MGPENVRSWCDIERANVRDDVRLTQRRREVSDSDSAPIRCSPNLIREIGEKVEITEPDEPWAANEPLCIYMISKGFYAPVVALPSGIEPLSPP
jgi:hypothetical protein